MIEKPRCNRARKSHAWMSEREARTAAMHAFGGVTQIREIYRMQRGLPWLEQTARDIRFALRQLRRSQGFHGRRAPLLSGTTFMML